MRFKAALIALAVGLLVAAVPAAVAPDEAKGKRAATVSVQLLSFNDFHGNLEPPAGSTGRIGAVDAGGAEYFATHLAQLRATNPNTIVAGAGDTIGATPLLSALFHDEPTVEALNEAGLEVTSVGNHEFDEGWAELYRMQKGGCHPTDKCQDGTPFTGAKYQYLSANVFLNPKKADKKELTRLGFKPTPKRPYPMLPPYLVKQVGGVKVGFIGMTLEATPEIVTPSGIAPLRFYNEAYMANYWAQNLRKQGVRTIVVLIHEGGFQTGGNENTCVGMSGPIVSLTNLMSNDIDAVVSGHTHNSYNCMIGTKLVTSAASFGRLITDIDLEIDTATGDVVSKRALNRIVTRVVAKDPEESALISRYNQLAAPLANRVIGRISGDITRATNAAGESALGDVIADAQLAATRPAGKGAAVIAFMNPGGIRADLTFGQQSGNEQPGEVTFGESFTVQPFGNSLVTKTMTGDMIKRLLEQQFDNPARGQDRILQVSNGFAYTYARANAAGSRVQTMSLGGQPIVATRSYRVTMNSFLATGGDGFAVFNEGTNPLGGDVDTDALEAYFRANSPVAPGARNRITRVN